MYSKGELRIIVDNVTVEQVNQTKFLGVNIDSKLNLTAHIDHVATKISKNIGIITRARKFLNKKTLTGLYYTFIYPYLNYCCTVWGMAPTTHLSKLHKLQKGIVRIISGRPRLYHSSDLFKDLRILPIYELNTYKLAIFCHKWKFHSLPRIYDDFLTSIEDIHDHFTRISNQFFIKTPRTDNAKNSVRYKAPSTWNDLDDEKPELLILEDDKIFKQNLISHPLMID